VYVKRLGALIVAIALYVNDFIIVTNEHKKILPQTKVLLCVEFDMFDMGNIEIYHLGIQIKRNLELCIMELN
jgi:hypothetical protein